MRTPRIVAILAVALLAVVVGGIASADPAAQSVSCSYDPAVSTGCSAPQDPVTVTETTTATETTTETPAPVTTTATVTAPGPTTTVLSTVTGPTTTVIGPTTTVTVTATTPTTTAPTTTASTTTAATTTATTTTTTAPPGAFPGASNTGVPAGTTLTAYTGSCNINTANTVIDAKTLNCDLVVNAANIKITRSQINGRIASTNDNGSISITDSAINGGNQETFPAVGQENITLLRVNVSGGQHSVQCWANCVVTDSWLHGQYLPSTSAGHVNAFISNGGSHFILTHNTLDCSVTSTSKGGGCTADASLFGDFGQINDVTYDRNLFVSHSTQAYYCTQAGHNPGKAYPTGTNIRYTNNVFQRGTNGKCGQGGPVTAYQAGNGNVWTGNIWSPDGAVVPPA